MNLWLMFGVWGAVCCFGPLLVSFGRDKPLTRKKEPKMVHNDGPSSVLEHLAAAIKDFTKERQTYHHAQATLALE